MQDNRGNSLSIVMQIFTQSTVSVKVICVSECNGDLCFRVRMCFLNMRERVYVGVCVCVFVCVCICMGWGVRAGALDRKQPSCNRLATVFPTVLQPSCNCLATVLQVDRKKPSPIRGVSYLLCSLIKNPEEEDPPRRICTRYFEGGPPRPGS